jgi:haloacetate dehalogenase
MFEGFEARDIPTSETTIHIRIKGNGPPLLLLHGYPQNHAMWHAVAPVLAERFTVVCADLRGYGDSGKPEPGPGIVNYTKRAMARDMVEVMGRLGFPQFGVAGHDRGGRVSYRMALDHPGAVTKLATLDIVPTYVQWQTMATRQGGLGGYHWYFLAQPAPLPERLIGADPIYYLHNCLARWAAPDFTFDPAAMAEYERCFAKPEVVHGSCNCYRAGATLDVDIDAADYGKKKIACPMLALWGDRTGRRPGLIPTWQEWADDVRGEALPCGHFLPEEAPAETTRALLAFFSE